MRRVNGAMVLVFLALVAWPERSDALGGEAPSCTILPPGRALAIGETALVSAIVSDPEGLPLGYRL